MKKQHNPTTSSSLRVLQFILGFWILPFVVIKNFRHFILKRKIFVSFFSWFLVTLQMCCFSCRKPNITSNKPSSIIHIITKQCITSQWYTGSLAVHLSARFLLHRIDSTYWGGGGWKGIDKLFLTSQLRHSCLKLDASFTPPNLILIFIFLLNVFLRISPLFVFTTAVTQLSYPHILYLQSHCQQLFRTSFMRTS